MNAPPHRSSLLPVRETPGWFRPVSFILGLAGAMVALSCLGSWLGTRNSHPGFTRFIPALSPETSYFPTIAEMCAIVRARCRPDQVLVIVGGNSIFYGSGQPLDDLWTRRLQALLGDRYSVVNLAFRGAAAADGGALVAEVLRQEYPRQIYVTNVGVMQAADPAGSDPYRFAFWEAYYKGLLMNYAPRNRALQVHYQGSPGDRQTRVEIIGRVWLDRVLHFRDLWNWIGMRWVFTVPIVYYPTWTERLQPRQNYTDEEGNFDDTPFEQRFSDRGLDIELRILRGSTEGYYQPAGDGGWVLNAVLRQRFVDLNRAIMPEPLRRRTLIVVSKNSPYYVDKLTAPEQARDDQAYQDSVKIWRDSGYHAITYASDITAEDYGDRAHLTVSGGRKLAALVAENVRAIAAEQGYLSSSVPKP